ncbi:hypothetical protein L7F22_022159 [Adiantum nelumboides]|nr:hypothetical protein [Adiantum nelumboides]
MVYCKRVTILGTTCKFVTGYGLRRAGRLKHDLACTDTNEASLHDIALEALTRANEVTLTQMPDVRYYNRLIISLIKTDQVNEALAILADMEKNGCIPNVITYNSLIDGLCKFKNIGNALAMLTHIEKRGCTPNVCTYTSLIAGLSKPKEVDKAHAILAQMEKRRCSPGVYTYNSLIDGLLKAKEVGKALTIMTHMDKRGCDPNVHTYTILIDGMLKAKEISKALTIMTHMNKSGCNPNVCTYTALIDGLLKANEASEVQKALAVVIEMEKRGCPPNVHTYNSLINGLLKAKEVDRAFSILTEMEKRGCAPIILTYTSLLDGLLKANKVNKALAILSEMENRECIPDAVTYDVVMTWIAGQQKAKGWFEASRKDAQFGLEQQQQQQQTEAIDFERDNRDTKGARSDGSARSSRRRIAERTQRRAQRTERGRRSKEDQSDTSRRSRRNEPARANNRYQSRRGTELYFDTGTGTDGSDQSKWRMNIGGSTIRRREREGEWHKSRSPACHHRRDKGPDLKIACPIFKRKKHDDLDVHIQAFEQYAELKHILEEERGEYFPHTLKEVARKWYYHYPASKLQSYRKLKKAFVLENTDDRGHEDILCELDRIKQGKLSAKTYVQNIKKLTRTLNEPPSKKRMRAWFLSGFSNKKLREQEVPTPTKKFIELVHRALKLEQQAKKEKHRHKASFFELEEYKKKKKKGSWPKKIDEMSRKIFEISGLRGPSRKVEKWCTKYQSKSHTSDDCTLCNYCKAFGHIWNNYKIRIHHLKEGKDLAMIAYASMETIPIGTEQQNTATTSGYKLEVPVGTMVEKEAECLKPDKLVAPELEPVPVRAVIRSTVVIEELPTNDPPMQPKLN